jgi:hypothetical protein
MNESRYKLHRISEESPGGTTGTSYCSMDAVLKFDCPESQHCVYNEWVAVKLAQSLHIAIADGVITATGDGPAYASLQLDSPGIELPDVTYSDAPLVVARYHDEAAAITLFDILIGNWDRSGNLKASLISRHLPVFCGYDHSYTLLDCDTTPKKSLNQLKSNKLIVDCHPFYGLLSVSVVETWANRIANLDNRYFHECCLFGRPFRTVTQGLQQQLADALTFRKDRFPDIIAANIGKIAGQS